MKITEVRNSEVPVSMESVTFEPSQRTEVFTLEMFIRLLSFGGVIKIDTGGDHVETWAVERITGL